MKVLHLVNRLKTTGDGIVNVAVDLMCQQADHGHDVHVATAGGGYCGLVSEHGVEVHTVDFTRRTPLRTLKAYWALWRLVKAVGPDVVHSHVITGTVLARALPTRTRVVATVHNEWQKGVVLMGLAHAVVGVSRAVSNAMASRRISKRRIHTVLNGVIGSPRRSGIEDLPSPGLSRPAIVTLGSVSQRKGSDVLFSAFEAIAADVSDAHLYFIGNVDWAEFRDRVCGSPIRERVHFVGHDEQPQRYIAEADVFAFPSRREPLGLALLEAMQVGVPIVASRIDGIPEALANGKAGVLVPAEDGDRLGAAILQLLRDRSKAAEYAAAAKSRSREFTVTNMARGYDAVYRTVTSTC